MLMSWFVPTADVDGRFRRAGFDPGRIAEARGVIDWMPCTGGRGAGVFPADPCEVVFDGGTTWAEGPLPECPKCGAPARPNDLMLGGDDRGRPGHARKLAARMMGLGLGRPQLREHRGGHSAAADKKQEAFTRAPASTFHRGS
jgi:hypothetical protein